MIVAVDTGGTKTLVGAFTENGALLQTIKFPTPRSIPLYIDELRKAIDKLTPHGDIAILSLAVPASIRPNQELTYAPNLGWRNVNLPTLLRRYFDCEIIIENDANLAGLAETRQLKTPPRTCLYVTIGTGIGTAVLVNGSLHPAFTFSEGGQAVLEYDGKLRVWEQFAAGSAIHQAYGKYAYEITSRRTWDQIADRISRGLLGAIPLLQPDLVIIGGGIGTHFDHYGPHLKQLLDERLPRHIIARPKIIPAAKPQEAALYGCYYHAVDRAA
jgi:predicted NBD/HSP70 family sugar kinase